MAPKAKPKPSPSPKGKARSKAKAKAKCKAKPKTHLKSEVEPRFSTDVVLHGEPILRMEAPSFKAVLEKFAAAAVVPEEPEMPLSRQGPFSGSWGNGRIAERFPRRLQFEAPEQLAAFADAQRIGTFVLSALSRDFYLMGVQRVMRDSQLLLGGRGAYCTQYASRDDDVCLDVMFPLPGALPVCWEFHIAFVSRAPREFMAYAAGFYKHDPCRFLAHCRRPCIRAYTEALDLLQRSEAATPKFEARSPIPARCAVGITITDPSCKVSDHLSVQGACEYNGMWPKSLQLSVHPASEAWILPLITPSSSSSSSSCSGQRRAGQVKGKRQGACSRYESQQGHERSGQSLPLSAVDPELIRKIDGGFVLRSLAREAPQDFGFDVDSDYESCLGDAEHIYYVNEQTRTILVPDIRCGMDDDFLGHDDERYSGMWFLASYQPQADGGAAVEGSHRNFMRETMKRSFARLHMAEQVPIAGKHCAEFDVWVPVPELKMQAKFEAYELEPGRPVDVPSHPFTMEVREGVYLVPSQNSLASEGAERCQHAGSGELPLLWEVKLQILKSSTTIPPQSELAKWPSTKRFQVDQWLPLGKWVEPTTCLGKEFRPLLHPRRLFPDEPQDDEGYMDIYDAIDVFWGPPSYPARAELFQNVPVALRKWMPFEGVACPSPQHARVFEKLHKWQWRAAAARRGRPHHPQTTLALDVFTVEVKRNAETEVDFRLCARPGALLAKLVRPLTNVNLKPISTNFEWRLSRRAVKKHYHEEWYDDDPDFDPEASQDEMDCYDPRLRRPGQSFLPRAGQPPLFPLLSNHGDPEHSQPPHFQDFPLRPEQLRSLQWMVNTEKLAEPFEAEIKDHENCRFLPHWQMEGRLKCMFTIRGGVLADKIGYGKTATTIGLVDCTSCELPPAPPITCNHIPSRATLVLCPANLHVQWINEIHKFTGTKLKVVSLQTFAQLKAKTVQDLMDADFVVATYRLFYSSSYLAHLAALVKEQTGRRFAFPKVPQASHRLLRNNSAKFEQAYAHAVQDLEMWTVNQLRSAKRSAGSFRCNSLAKKRRLNAAAGQGIRSSRQERSSGTVDGMNSEALGAGSSSSGEGVLNWKQRKNVPLEIFWWRRIVVDEFHELLTNYPPAQIAVCLFRSTSRWGLSGTPPCGTTQDIQKSASFFNCYLGNPHECGSSPADWQTENCQKWLNRCVRQNTAGMAELKCEERFVLVQQHSAERAIYLQLSQSPMEDNDLAEMENDDYFAQQRLMNRRENLLKLCSHFQLTGAQLRSSAADECEAVLKKHRREVSVTKAALKRALEASLKTASICRQFDWLFGHECGTDSLRGLEEELHAADLGTWPTQDGSDVNPGAGQTSAEEAKTFGRNVLREMTAPSGSTQAQKLSQKHKLPAAPAETESAAVKQKYKDALEAWHQTSNADVLLKEIRQLRGNEGISVGVARQKLKTLEGKLRQLRFFEQTLRAQRCEEVVDCPVCYEQVSLHERCILPCAHVGCMTCFMTTMSQQRRCPVCRASVQSKELMRLAPPAPIANAGQAITKASKYGSKIQALLEHLAGLLKADPENRIILFVQWEDLRKKVGSALTEIGVDHETLEGNIWQRRDTIQRFQGGHDAAGASSKSKSGKMEQKKRGRKSSLPTGDLVRILLLSLEHSASGTNFTSANHVVLFHPMLAETPQAGAAFEMQAIGRALRYGQQRTVEVWRFVTADTVEQQITEQHSQELWQRFRAQRVIGESGTMPSSIPGGHSTSTAASSGSAPRPREPSRASSSGARSSTD